MFDNETVLLLARSTPSATAQRTLLEMGQDQIVKARRLEIISNLCFNKTLHPQIWQALLSLPLHFREAAALLSNAPTPALASKILSCEHSATRVAALELGIKNLAPVDLQSLLNAAFLDVDHKVSLLISGMAPESVVAPYLKDILVSRYEHEPFTGKTYWDALFESLVANYTLIADEDVIAKAWQIGRNPNLSRLLDLRPSLTHFWVEKLHSLRYKDTANIRDSLATSRHLTEDDATKLYDLLLSKVTTRKQAHSTDPLTLATLRSMSMNPSISYSLRARSLESFLQLAPAELFEYPQRGKEQYEKDLLALRKMTAIGQPAISDWLKVPTTRLEYLRTAVRNLGEINYPTITSDPRFPTYDKEAERENQLLFEQGSPGLDSKGATAWKILIALAPNWESSYEDLVSTALLTAQ